MNKLLDMLPKAWPMCELPGYREPSEAFATYSGFSFEALPPISGEADDQFLWLKDEPEKVEWSLRDEEGEQQKL